MTDKENENSPSGFFSAAADYYNQYIKLNILASLLRNYLAAWFARDKTTMTLSALFDPEPCVWWIERKKKCGQPATIHCDIELVDKHSGHKLRGVRKMCLDHASE